MPTGLACVLTRVKLSPILVTGRTTHRLRAGIMHVIYAPSGHVIGQAGTPRGALRLARGIPKLSCERHTVSAGKVIDRADMPDFTPVWRIGVQLVTS